MKLLFSGWTTSLKDLGPMLIETDEYSLHFGNKSLQGFIHELPRNHVNEQVAGGERHWEHYPVFFGIFPDFSNFWIFKIYSEPIAGGKRPVQTLTNISWNFSNLFDFFWFFMFGNFHQVLRWWPVRCNLDSTSSISFSISFPRPRPIFSDEIPCMYYVYILLLHL